MADLDTLTSQVCPPERTRAADLGVLALRIGVGGLVAGHGAQKLFGAMGGPGIEGTAGWLKSMGLRPPKTWATLAGLSEFGGGALTALGLANPLGPIALQGAMATAIRQVHWDKPIWATEGGAELPAVYSLAGVALALTGPGRYSADRMLGIRVPRALSLLTAAGVAAGIIATEVRTAKAAKQQAGETAGEGAAAAEEGEDRLIDSQPASDTQATSDTADAAMMPEGAGDAGSQMPSAGTMTD